MWYPFVVCERSVWSTGLASRSRLCCIPRQKRVSHLCPSSRIQCPHHLHLQKRRSFWRATCHQNKTNIMNIEGVHVQGQGYPHLYSSIFLIIKEDAKQTSQSLWAYISNIRVILTNFVVQHGYRQDCSNSCQIQFLKCMNLSWPPFPPHTHSHTIIFTFGNRCLYYMFSSITRKTHDT